MSLRIEDGSGSGKQAKVNENFRLETYSVSLGRAADIANNKSLTFSAVFEDASAAAGNYVAYLKNTSTTLRLVVDQVRVSAGNAATWKLVTATGTATGGNAVTAVNRNRSSGIAPEITALADNIGGFTAGTPLIDMIRTPASAAAIFNVDDTLLLGTNDAIAIEYDAGTTGIASATIRFYFI